MHWWCRKCLFFFNGQLICNFFPVKNRDWLKKILICQALLFIEFDKAFLLFFFVEISAWMLHFCPGAHADHTFVFTVYEKTEDGGSGGAAKGNRHHTLTWIARVRSALYCQAEMMHCCSDRRSQFTCVHWTFSFCFSTEQKRRAPPEEKKCAPRGHLRGFRCGWRFQIGRNLNRQSINLDAAMKWKRNVTKEQFQQTSWAGNINQMCTPSLSASSYIVAVLWKTCVSIFVMFQNAYVNGMSETWAIHICLENTCKL